LPVPAQGRQESGREQGIAILPAFALANLEAHPIRRGLDVAHLEGTDFGEPQPGSVGGHQDGTGAQGIAGGEQPSDLVAREHHGQTLGHFGHRNLEPELALLQDVAEEEAAGAGGLIDAGVGQLLLLNQVQQVALDLLGVEPIRRAAVVLGQSRYAGQVGLPRAQRKSAQDHGIVHPLAQFSHVVLLVMSGTFPTTGWATQRPKTKRGGDSRHHRVSGLVQRNVGCLNDGKQSIK
jgi:hypothetical protein